MGLLFRCASWQSLLKYKWRRIKGVLDVLRQRPTICVSVLAPAIFSNKRGGRVRFP